jgi:hypothetical protein
MHRIGWDIYRERSGHRQEMSEAPEYHNRNANTSDYLAAISMILPGGASA